MTPCFQCRGRGFYLGRETKIPHASWCGQKINVKETKIWGKMAESSSSGGAGGGGFSASPGPEGPSRWDPACRVDLHLPQGKSGLWGVLGVLRGSGWLEPARGSLRGLRALGGHGVLGDWGLFMGHLMAAWGLRDVQASACVLRGQRGPWGTWRSEGNPRGSWLWYGHE